MGISVSTVIAFHEATIPESRHSCTLQHLQLWALFPLSLRRVRTAGFANGRSCPLPEQTPFSLGPPQDNAAQLIGEFKNTEVMIFGEAPSFAAILASIGALEAQLNRP